MPSFEIPDGPTNVPLKPGPGGDATGSATYVITNKTGATLAGRLGVLIAGGTEGGGATADAASRSRATWSELEPGRMQAGAAQEAWFTIEGERERDFPAGQSQNGTVAIRIPAGTPAGEYRFRLRAVAVNDPDNDFTVSPVATVTVADAPVVAPKKFPWWILGVLVALLVVGGIAAYFLTRPPGAPEVPEVATVAVPAVVDRPWLVAEDRVRTQGFQPVRVAGAPSGKAPETVIAQDPAGGAQAAAGSQVRITVDPGVAVPNLRNMTLTNAINRAGAVNLQIRQVSSRCEPGVASLIVDQNPAAGQRVAGATAMTVIVRDTPPCLRFRGTVGEFIQQERAFQIRRPQ